MPKKIIYAEDAIDALKQLQKSISGDYTELDPLVMAGCGYIGDCIGELECLPSAQPQRTKGRWIDVTKTGGAELWKCSECGELELEDSYFCPNCGSDNRGEDDE